MHITKVKTYIILCSKASSGILYSFVTYKFDMFTSCDSVKHQNMVCFCVCVCVCVTFAVSFNSSSKSEGDTSDFNGGDLIPLSQSLKVLMTINLRHQHHQQRRETQVGVHMENAVLWKPRRNVCAVEKLEKYPKSILET